MFKSINFRCRFDLIKSLNWQDCFPQLHILVHICFLLDLGHSCIPLLHGPARTNPQIPLYQYSCCGQKGYKQKTDKHNRSLTGQYIRGWTQTLSYQWVKSVDLYVFDYSTQRTQGDPGGILMTTKTFFSTVIFIGRCKYDVRYGMLSFRIVWCVILIIKIVFIAMKQTINECKSVFGQ